MADITDTKTKDGCGTICLRSIRSLTPVSPKDAIYSGTENIETGKGKAKTIGILRI